MLTTKPRQMKLHGLDPGRQSRAMDVSEKAIVDQAVQWGGLQHYEILLINQSVHFPRCPSCRQIVARISCSNCHTAFKPELFSGNTPGAPDTFWNRHEWGNWWRGIEAKKSGTAPVREEQQRLIELGVVDVAWSLEMFEAALRRR